MTVHIDVGTPAPTSTISRWDDEQRVQRLWSKDPTIWFDPEREEIANRLGWLDLPVTSADLIPVIDELAAAAVADGVTDLVLCGMGGSSLAPEVFAATLPVAPGHPALTVIDTTHPDAVAAVHDATDPSTTWYLVSSKSGGTLETLSLFRSFWASASEQLANPGDHFIAITDPGSSLARLADERGFRTTIIADPDVGGRYSALSAFGLVPAGIVGADVQRLLASARTAAEACGPSAPAASNPGIVLGVALGSAATSGRVVAHFDASDPAGSLPIWIEQLIAESTGKDGQGIVPVDGGPIPRTSDRSVTISIGEHPDARADIRIALDDPYDIAGAMFILEVATAVAGAEIGIHPFDQPDVQLAKTLAHQAMEGRLPDGGPEPVPLGSAVVDIDPDSPPLYISVQAYVEAHEATDAALTELRDVLAERHDSFVTIGYGPRFLHSTGQLHKGGPPGGIFLQLVDRPRTTMPVPETEYTFNDLVSAQAAGDRAALAGRDRTVIAIDLGNDAATGIRRVTETLRAP